MPQVAAYAGTIVAIGGAKYASAAVLIAVTAAINSALREAPTQQSTTETRPRERLLSQVVGGNEPGRYVVGTSPPTAGVLVHKALSGDQNRYFWQVTAFTVVPIDSFVTIYINGIPIDVATEIDGAGFVTKADFLDANGAKLCRLSLYDGTQVAADANMVAAIAEWGANHLGKDCAYIVARYEFDETFPTDPDHEDVWLGGEPQIQAVMRGVKAYNPDTGATEWTSNPAILARWILTNPAPYIGYGEPVTRIDDSVCIDSIAESDAIVVMRNNNFSFAFIPRYRCDGVIEVGHPAQTLDQIRATMAGTIAYVGPTWRIHAGKFDPLALKELTDDDVAGALTFEPFPAQNDRTNQVSGEYSEPARGGQMLPFKTRINIGWRIADTQELEKRISLPLCNDRQRAQWLAGVALRSSRPVMIHGRFHLTAFPLELHEIVTCSFDSLSYQANMRIMRWAWDGEGVELTLRSESTNDWFINAFVDLEDHVLPPALTEYPFTPLAPANLRTRPQQGAIGLEWTNAPAEHIREIEIWVSDDNDRDNATLAGSTTGDEWVYFINQPVQDFAYFWVRTVGRNGRRSAFHPAGQFAGVFGVSLLNQNDLVFDSTFDLSLNADYDFWELHANPDTPPTSQTTIEAGEGINGSAAAVFVTEIPGKNWIINAKRFPMLGGGEIVIQFEYMSDQATTLSFRLQGYLDLIDATADSLPPGASFAIAADAGVWHEGEVVLTMDSDYAFGKFYILYAETGTGSGGEIKFNKVVAFRRQ